MKTLKEIQEKIKNKEKLHIILDYNNRITPYIRTSMSYFFSPMFKRIIENFAKKEYIQVSLITDKNIKNFKKEFPISTENIDLYGVVGAEKETQENKETIFDDKLKKELKKLYNQLSKTFIDNKKLIIEYEDWAIFIHDKGLSKEDIKPIKKEINEQIKKSKFNEELTTFDEENKIVITIADIRINSLLDKLIEEYNDYTSMYIGKEETTFKYLKKKCNTLKVIHPSDSMESKADLVIFRAKFEEFLSETNNLYI